MKTKTTLVVLALSLALAAVCLAASPQMGTWKLNEGKSKFSPGAAKNKTVVYQAAGASVKVIVDGIDGAGKATHNEWTGKFDGKDYAVTGDANFDMRAYKQVDDHTLDMTLKKGGKVVGTGKIVVATDGKSRTVTTTATDAKGKKSTNTAVYAKK